MSEFDEEYEIADVISVREIQGFSLAEIVPPKWAEAPFAAILNVVRLRKLRLEFRQYARRGQVCADDDVSQSCASGNCSPQRSVSQAKGELSSTLWQSTFGPGERSRRLQ